MSGPGRLVVTGAGGFLGRATIAAARTLGHPVTAIVRAEPDPAWTNDPEIEVARLDLASEDAQARLAGLVDGAAAIIHTAARLSGTDGDHARDTLRPTEILIEAMLAAPHPARLILVSSFAVYGYAVLPAGCTLDERAPTEPDPDHRDSYCRAKLGQEAVAIGAAQRRGLSVRLMRVGTLYGPERIATARQGIELGPLLLSPNGHAPIPAIHVGDCARALVLAAAGEIGPSDFPVTKGAGRIDIVNLVAPMSPDQAEWRARAGSGGKRMLRLPIKPLLKIAKLFDLVGALLPGLGRRLPAILREATLSSRFKTLRYSTARAEDRLGWRPDADFATHMQKSRRGE